VVFESSARTGEPNQGEGRGAEQRAARVERLETAQEFCGVSVLQGGAFVFPSLASQKLDFTFEFYSWEMHVSTYNI